MTDSAPMTAPEGTKKKKLTGIEKPDGRRLVEYLVVVSSLPRGNSDKDEKKGEEWNLSTSFDDEDVEISDGFKPVITARYPLEDHEDNPLHESMTFFCHPSGSIHLKKDLHMPKVRLLLHLKIDMAKASYSGGCILCQGKSAFPHIFLFDFFFH